MNLNKYKHIASSLVISGLLVVGLFLLLNGAPRIARADLGDPFVTPGGSGDCFPSNSCALQTVLNTGTNRGSSRTGLGGSMLDTEAAGGILIDHHTRDVGRIPAQWLDAAKQNVVWAYGSTSHGTQLWTRQGQRTTHSVGAPQQQSYYVSTSGSDSTGDGSIANPFRTIARALASAASGDEIVLRGAPALTNNVYQESVRIELPNITLRSQDGEWAVISCPVNDENIASCVRFDVDSSGGRLQRVEIIGGYYYGVKFETRWDWGDPNNSTGASNILLEDVKIHHTGNAAIKITPGCDNITIRRAELYNTGLTVRPDSAEGIDNVNGDHMVVQDSYIHDIAGTGLYFKGGAMDCVVERNRIEHTGTACSPQDPCGGGVFVGFDTSPEYFDLTVNPEYYESIRGIVRNNLIRDSRLAGVGLYGAQDAQVLNNTLIDTAQDAHSPIYFGLTYQDWEPEAGRPPSINPLIRNNLVFQSRGLPTECVFIRYSEDLGGLSALSGMPNMDYNLYHHANTCTFTDQRPDSLLEEGSFAQWQTHIGGDTHSLTSDPQLATNGSLTAHSPAIDAGDGAYCPSPDLSGVLRPQGSGCDIGAYEYAIHINVLNITKSGTGSGTVTSNPTGISCGADCTESYPSGTVVTLTATPDPGSTFAGWSGDADCSDGQVTINASTTCTATFTLSHHIIRRRLWRGSARNYGW